MNEKKKQILFYSSAVFIVFIGILLRVLFYSYERPFWNDESALALNILNRGYSQLFSPLDYNQASPVLFAVMSKFCLVFSKNWEYALRFPSLVFGIASIPVFFMLAKKLLKTKIAVIFSLILFSFNYQLIYFSQELKHYSAEVFFFLSILLLCFSIDVKKLKTPSLLLISFFLALAPWFSYTSVIAEVILFFVLFLKDKKKTLTLFALPVLSCIALFPLVQRMNSSSFLHMFWSEGFIKKDFSNFPSLLQNNSLFYFPDFSNKFLIGLMCAMGLWGYAKDGKKLETNIVFLPLLLAVILAYLKIYPLYLRTALYMFPLVLILLSKPFDMFRFEMKLLNLFVAGFLLAHFGLCSLKTDYLQIIKKQYYQETTASLIKEFVSVSKPNDILVVTESGRINYELYKRRFAIDEGNVFLMNKNLYDAPLIKNVYSLLPKNKTYYVLLTHSGDKMNEYKNLCDYAKKMENPQISDDKNFNALIRFSTLKE